MRITRIVLLFFFFISCFNLFSQGYKIEIQIKQLADSNVFLGYHYGNEQFVIDTAHLNKSGKGVFEGKKDLPEGVYMIVLAILLIRYIVLLEFGKDEVMLKTEIAKNVPIALFIFTFTLIFSRFMLG